MAANPNVTTTTDINVTAREIDFVSRFATNWDALREILGVARMIKKVPGAVLKTKSASVTLQSGTVAEGDLIPRSKATVTETPIGEMTLEKYSKETTFEAINENGYDVAVQMTDDAFLAELQTEKMADMYDFLATGSLTSTETTFQMGLAMAVGKVRDKWKSMHKTATEVVAFVNTLDAYKYLGAAQLSVQTQFGMDYIENFLGARRVILSSEVAAGKIIATPIENLVCYYVDASDPNFSRAELKYTTAGETPLIGVAVRGDYDRATSVIYAMLGIKLFAEYQDGIAVITVTPAAETAVSE